MATKTDNKQDTTPAIDTSDWSQGNVNIDGWYDPDKSGQIQGRCVEAIRINTAYGEQDVVKVKLFKPAKALNGKGEQASVDELKMGQVMAVRISMNLSLLLELVPNQCAVEITPTGKKKTSAGRQILTYNVKYKGVKAAPAAKPAVTTELPEGAGAPGDNDEPLPF
jgi:hypothetical protein